MTRSVLYIERRPSPFVSLERVFRAVARELSPAFRPDFQQVPFGNHVLDIVHNLLTFRPRSADIHHITGHVHYIALLCNPRHTVLTIPDVGFLDTSRGLRRWALRKLFLDWPVRRLAWITAISEHTRRRILDATGCDARKVRVLACPLVFNAKRRAAPPMQTSRPTILQIGTTANKNIPTLARALAGLPCRLRIIGAVDDALSQVLRAAGVEFEHAMELSDEDIAEEYARADLVCFCSLSEGFGLPIIEAQASGTPVVTSHRSPMIETAGGGAALADPEDPASIRGAIERVITDARYRDELLAAGHRNVERFSAARIAAGYEALYQEMLDGPPSASSRRAASSRAGASSRAE